MNCLDCMLADHTVPAIGTCRSCGAGVCLDCARLDTHVVSVDGTPGRSDRHETRSLTCRSCAAVIQTMHPLAYHGAGAIPALH
jgi:hypothetical protein